MYPTPRASGGDTLTRRSLIKRAGILGGALALASTGWEKTVGRAVAAIAPTAEMRHRRTYVALAETVVSSDANNLAEDSARMGALFDDWYKKQPAETQRMADSLLEDLEQTLDGEKFHKAAKGKRLEHVRS